MEINKHPGPIPENALKGIFILQRALIQPYIEMGDIPKLPIDLDSKQGQSWMKKMIGRGAEELAEAHQVFREIFEIANSNKDVPLERVIEFNEELSDSLHFFIEALIYSNIDEDAIADYYHRLIHNQGSVDNGEVLLNAELMAAFDLMDNGYEIPGHGFFIPNRLVKGWAGQRVSMTHILEQAQMMWDVVFNFNIACNYLKNREWRQAETNIPRFQEQMMLGFLSLMNLLVYSGLNRDTIFEIYYHKNVINHQRITTK